MLVDTHCHIHESDYPLDIDVTLKHARDAEVTKVICVGTSVNSSSRSVKFAAKHSEAYGVIGVHPHDSKEGYKPIAKLIGSSKLVAIGEIGLDYHYNHSPHDVQAEALQWQINLAITSNLPIIFHVREAFDDFWAIFDNFKNIRGVMHSFTDSQVNLEAGLRRGLLAGINGISTFTRDEAQKAIFASIPLDRLLLETDAPLLSPAPHRGKTNEPAFIRNIAEHQAEVRDISLNELATVTTSNAIKLFGL
jgi:TatD DNase family protein